MLVPGSANPLLLRTVAAPAAGGISRSLRFNSSDSAYLSRTPTSAGNRKTWTVSAWCKRSVLGTQQGIFEAGTGAGTDTWAGIFFGSNNTLTGGFGLPGAGTYVASSAVFRDTAAWYHIVCAVDTTNATSTDRVKLWVNNSRITAFSDQTYDAQNTDSIMSTTNLHVIGQRRNNSTAYLNGYLADIYFIDGQALTPSSFTETDATTGQLIPKAFSGSYGSQGWHLEFADNSSNTATTLGKDTSGNSNNWTPNNLSVTAGAGNDSLVDVPINGSQTDTGVGGEVRGNYCTINPLNNGGVTLVNGNLDWTRSAAGSTAVAYSTIAVSSGKWYFETTMNGAGSGVNWECGVATTTTANNIRPGTTATGWGLVTSSTTIIYKQNSNSLTSIFSGTLSTGDVIGVAFDLDNGRIWFARNGTWLEGSPSAGTGASYTNLSGTVSAFFGGDGTAVNGAANFGARSFAYTAPSGFKALCTANLPAPLVTKPNTVFDTVLWTGNDTGQTITMPGAFSPDLVWTKMRSSANAHWLFDVIRGTNQGLSSSSTTNELTRSSSVTAFGSTGFTLGTSADVNSSAYTYVAWAWDAGSSTVTNTQGSITSSVRANATAGFSVITATTTNTSSQTFGHGLGVAPVFHIIKLRNGTDDWYVYHSSVGATQYLKLNATTAATTSSALYANTAPTSSVITLGSGWNSTSYNIVCYAFAPVVGYTSISSYTGNGSSDGVFVYTGMRPRWIMIKRTDTTSNWTIIDTAREGYNVDNDPLYPNLFDAEGTTDLADILSNGFKLRSSDASVNASSGTYIYVAFSEVAFNFARAR
jgi:hypothetical protein